MNAVERSFIIVQHCLRRSLASRGRGVVVVASSNGVTSGGTSGL